CEARVTVTQIDQECRTECVHQVDRSADGPVDLAESGGLRLEVIQTARIALIPVGADEHAVLRREILIDFDVVSEIVRVLRQTRLRVIVAMVDRGAGGEWERKVRERLDGHGIEPVYRNDVAGEGILAESRGASGFAAARGGVVDLVV